MGYRLLDQYTLLHFAVGVVAYFWIHSFWTAFGLHFAFEILENTPAGMAFLNKAFPKEGWFRWPGDKVAPDSWSNFVGDNGAFAIGFLLAKLLDELSTKQGWYYKH